MSQFLGFSNGSSGDLVISSDTTDSPTDSSCPGSSGSTSLSATNAGFAAGQLILIHQTRGTGVGNWEINYIVSYVAGTITTLIPLVNTYTDSGASQAQVLVLKQYSSVTINSGVTLTAKAWDGNVGGILAFLCNGTVTVTGGISASETGYRNGTYSGVDPNRTGQQGEGTSGADSQSTAANGNGGGGGGNSTGGESGGGGGGGGHSAAGTAGGADNAAAGSAGALVGTADLTTMFFGGAGGGSAKDQPGDTPNNGGDGGGMIFIGGGTIIVSGGINANGGTGQGNSGNATGGGGGGAGGSIFLKSRNAILGNNLINAAAGSGGAGGSSNNGGAGAAGRIRVETCSLTGMTNPTASEAVGGHNWCSSIASII